MQNISPEAFSDLIGQIYDCALQPAGWVAALTRINAIVEGAYATISLADTQTFAGVMAAHSPWDPEQLRILNDDYGIDGVPGLREVIFGPIDLPRSTLHQMSEAEFQTSAFYRNWAAPQGLRDGCITKFAQTDGRLGLLGVITRADRGIIEESERQFIALLSPHVRRAAMIGDMLDQTRLIAHFYRTSLDTIATPIILVDATSRVIHVNQAAERMVLIGSPIQVKDGRLEAGLSAANAALVDAIARSAHGDGDIGNRGIGIPLTQDRNRPAVAYVLPVMRGAVREALRPAAAAVFIATAATAMPPPPDALATLFDLTPAEVRVLLQVVDGGSLKDVADALGIGENTVKSHLGRIFTKTGATRQSELVKLIAGLSSVGG
jgi:DNA-binding CsgD family transcriptional regulator/PAS domain-containing protein